MTGREYNLLLLALFVAGGYVLRNRRRKVQWMGLLAGAGVSVLGVRALESGQFMQYHGAAPPIEGPLSTISGALFLGVGFALIYISCWKSPDPGPSGK